MLGNVVSPVFLNQHVSEHLLDSCWSVARSCLTLQGHELQHVKLPCPLVSPGICSNSCPLSQWHCLTIYSSVTTFSSCPQSFPASGSFPMNHLFTSGGQSIGASALPSVPLMNIQSWFLLGLTSLISLESKRLSRVFSSTTVWKHQFRAQPSLWSNSHMPLSSQMKPGWWLWPLKLRLPW